MEESLYLHIFCNQNPQDQRFLFLLLLWLVLALGSEFKFEDDNLSPTAELHKALSTSDGVKMSSFELNSCTQIIILPISMASIMQITKIMYNLDYLIKLIGLLYSVSLQLLY